MSHKKNKIPVNVLKKFDKVLFKVGDPVIIKWLGEILHGYVKKTKKSNDGIYYTVEAQKSYEKRSYRYPCGIQIGEYSTKYNSGIILYEETKRAYTGGRKELLKDANWQADAVRNDNQSVRGHDDSNQRKDAKPRNNDTTKNDAKRGSGRVRSNTKTSRKNSAVDDAVNKQKDFLRGFVKK